MIPNTDRTKFLLLYQFNQFLDSTLANVSFQDYVKIKQILLACQSNTLLENTGRNFREALIRAKMVQNFFVLADKIWGPLYFGLGY